MQDEGCSCEVMAKVTYDRCVATYRESWFTESNGVALHRILTRTEGSIWLSPRTETERGLFRNVLGRPGLRVRLVGDTGNPHGVGAMIRLQFESEMGPAREIHAGSGYWSQDSSVQVLAGQGEPTGIWVRWPNGKETTTSLTRGATEVMIRTDGTVDTSS